MSVYGSTFTVVAMIELEDGFSENDKYLIREYEKHGSDDFLLVDLGEKTYVVPYKYTIGSHSGKTSQQRFLNALLDFEDMEIGKYNRAGQPVLSVAYEGRDYVVPFERKGRFSPQDLADELHHKADTKYNAVINAARSLEKNCKPVDLLDFSTFSANKYAKDLADLNSTMLLDEKSPEKLNILKFLNSVFDKKVKNFHTSTRKMANVLGKKIIEDEREAAKDFIPKYYKVSALAAMVGLSATAGFLSQKQNADDDNAREPTTEHVVNLGPDADDIPLITETNLDIDTAKTQILPQTKKPEPHVARANKTDKTDKADKTNNKTTDKSNTAKSEVKTTNKETQDVARKTPDKFNGYFVNFMGKKYTDTYGNIHLMQKLKPEISALLISVEGFTHDAFRDGGGTPTIGAGTTFYLNEKGKETYVQMGDKASTWRGMLHKWRYINKYMVEYLGDDFGRPCTPREAMASVGAGFCWGPSGFGNSEFLKSMKNNEKLSLQLRKLSGFRKQKGLLKRSYVLACCLAGVWTPKDLLDLPVYKLKDKGFVHCAIYTLDLHEILPCRKDANGNYLKDEDNNDIPKIAKDGYCFDFYLDKALEIKEKLIADAKKSNIPYKTVRQLLPDDMVKSIEKENYVRAELPHSKLKQNFAAMTKMLQNAKE